MLTTESTSNSTPVRTVKTLNSQFWLMTTSYTKARVDKEPSGIELSTLNLSALITRICNLWEIASTKQTWAPATEIKTTWKTCTINSNWRTRRSKNQRWGLTRTHSQGLATKTRFRNRSSTKSKGTLATVNWSTTSRSKRSTKIRGFIAIMWAAFITKLVKTKHSYSINSTRV